MHVLKLLRTLKSGDLELDNLVRYGDLVPRMVEDTHDRHDKWKMGPTPVNQMIGWSDWEFHLYVYAEDEVPQDINYGIELHILYKVIKVIGYTPEYSRLEINIPKHQAYDVCTCSSREDGGDERWQRIWLTSEQVKELK